mgnify:FL=1
MKNDTEKFNLDENKFTNESELEYPTEEDFIDIKVLNNNTRLLNEKKVDIESIENVARESTPMAIENAVKNINSGVSQNLQGVAKESSQYNIENKVKSIEDKVKNLDKIINDSISNNKFQKWTSLSNINERSTVVNINYSGEKELLNVSGSGNLIMCAFDLSSAWNEQNTTSDKIVLKIEIDDEVILNLGVKLARRISNYTIMSQVGIINDSFITLYEERVRGKTSALPMYRTGQIVRMFLATSRFLSLGSQEQQVSISGGFNYGDSLNFVYLDGNVVLQQPIPFARKLRVSAHTTKVLAGSITMMHIYNLN